MGAPTCFSITLPYSGSVPSAFWEMLNWGAVDRILWMGVLCSPRTTSLGGEREKCVLVFVAKTGGKKSVGRPRWEWKTSNIESGVELRVVESISGPVWEIKFVFGAQISDMLMVAVKQMELNYLNMLREDLIVSQTGRLWFIVNKTTLRNTKFSLFKSWRRARVEEGP
jgi:hypothetical protein